MSYPKTGQEVYVSLNLSNTMLTGIGKGTITREEVSVDSSEAAVCRARRHRLRQAGAAPPAGDRQCDL